MNPDKRNFFVLKTIKYWIGVWFFRKECCSRVHESIFPSVIVRGYRSKKPKSISPTVVFVRSTVRENQNQFSRRENCSLSLALTLFDFFKIEKPCPFELRGIFLNRTPYSFLGLKTCPFG